MFRAFHRHLAVLAALVLTVGMAFSGCGGGGSTLPSTPNSASATPGASPTVPPGTIYQSLYNAIAPEVSGFTTSVDQTCPNPGNSTEVFAEDNGANSNTIFAWLPGKSATQITDSVTNAIDYAQSMQQMMGIQGVTIDISYPVLVNNSANLPNSNFTTTNYSAYLNYYQRVVSGIQELGMKVNVETNIIFPSLLTPPQTPAQYYNGLTETMLENGVAEVAQHVIDDIKPNDIDLATEPSTIDYNTGLSGIDTPSGFAGYVAAIQAQISSAGSSTVVGAGSDDWETYNYYADLQTNGQSFQHFDIHIYPPDFLQTNAIAYLQNLKSTGVPTFVTENWIDKESQSVDHMIIVPSTTIEIRDAYSFWAPLDAQYITTMLRLANCNNAQFISFNHVNQLFAYIGYNSTTANYTYSQMQQAEITARQAAIAGGTLTASGNAIRAYFGLVPLAHARHSR